MFIYEILDNIEDYNINKKSYVDVTFDWLINANPNSHQIEDSNYFETIDGVKYYVDGKHVILDYSDREYEVANWLKNTFGGPIYMLPRVNVPNGVQTADYIFKDELWDLKEINGNGKRTIDGSIKNRKKQSVNFIFDVTYSSLTESEILEQAKRIYITAGREWVNKIIIKERENLIAVFVRNNKRG